MLGQNRVEAAVAADRAAMRNAAITYLNENLQEDVAKVDLGVIIGAAELAERMGLFTHNEFLYYHTEAYRLNKEFEERKKQENMRKATERKAAKLNKS